MSRSWHQPVSITSSLSWPPSWSSPLIAISAIDPICFSTRFFQTSLFLPTCSRTPSCLNCCLMSSFLTWPILLTSGIFFINTLISFFVFLPPLVLKILRHMSKLAISLPCTLASLHFYSIPCSQEFSFWTLPLRLKLHQLSSPTHTPFPHPHSNHFKRCLLPYRRDVLTVLNKEKQER